MPAQLGISNIRMYQSVCDGTGLPLKYYMDFDSFRMDLDSNRMCIIAFLSLCSSSYDLWSWLDVKNRLLTYWSFYCHGHAFSQLLAI